MKAPRLLPLFLFAACSSKAAETALPPPQLAPAYPDLQRIAGSAPAAPGEAAQKELQQLWEALFADTRLAARAEKDLREHADAVWLLEQHLADFDEAHRIRAAWLLGQLGPPVAALPLLLRCKDEVRPAARMWLADALWRLGNDSMLLDLVQAMDRGELANDAGRMAIERLRRAGIDPGEAPTYVFLQDQLRRLYRHWHDCGEAQRPAGQPPLDADRFQPPLARRLLMVSEHNLRFCDEARFIFGSSGLVGLPLLRLCLAAAERDLRDMALQTIIYLGPVAGELQAPTQALLADPLLAATAVRALAEMRADGALPLIRPLLDHPDLELRCAATGALGLLGDRADLQRLQQLQGDDTQPMDVRVQAAFSLGVFETEHPARRFLQQLRRDGTFHQGTLDRLLDRLQQLEQLEQLRQLEPPAQPDQPPR